MPERCPGLQQTTHRRPGLDNPPSQRVQDQRRPSVAGSGNGHSILNCPEDQMGRVLGEEEGSDERSRVPEPDIATEIQQDLGSGESESPAQRAEDRFVADQDPGIPFAH